jgi:NAD(P)-dependent dehydrogenase (short-subunit alcohol dehydrogenase family)
VETAHALASAGAHVTLAVRNISDGRRAAADIRNSTGSGHIDTRHLDLADLLSTRQQHAGCGNCRTTSRHNALIRSERKIQRIEARPRRSCR